MTDFLSSHHYWDLTEDDWARGADILGVWREPDLTIAPNDTPYLYRWFIYRSRAASVYLHLQVADDPHRPLHDHPWDSMSVILSKNAYIEIIATADYEAYHGITNPFPIPMTAQPMTFQRKQGETIYRPAAWGHRLLLPLGASYVMTLFSTGPVIRNWGFWANDGWLSHDEVTKTEEGVSTWR